MANIANGYLSINLDKTLELNKNAVCEIINNLKNNNLFKYGGDCEVSFNEKDKEIYVDFTCKWDGNYCWEWIENEISDEKNNKELNYEARILLLNAEIIGGSYEYGNQYRDKVYKKNYANKLDKYNHIKIASDWPEVLEIISAYDLKKEDSQIFGNSIEITLCEKSEEEQYLFKIVGQNGSFILLIDRKSKQVKFFCDKDYFIGDESIKFIISSIESGELEPKDDDAEECIPELIDDLIGENDNFFELD